MKKIHIFVSFCALTLASVSASASPTTPPGGGVYDLRMELSLNGKPVSAPRVVVREGEPATITQGNAEGTTFVEVTAAEGSIQGRNGILMKFEVGTISPAGKRQVLATPRVLAREGEPARITQADTKTGAEMISLSVVARKR